ncbi:MAG: BTAD domain-containing putative transcriptional regulator [Candidatus Promineifilaceae bacterium]
MTADTPSPMRLSLRLLGPFQASIGQAPLPESRAKKIEALLIYLALSEGEAHRRENLVGLLFPDMPDEMARTNLRQSLTRLRRAIRDQEADPPFLWVSRESVQFNSSSQHMLDVAEFRRLQHGCPGHRGQRDGRCPACMARAQQALDLYRGPFLDGFFLEDSVAFDEWVLSQRERFREAALALAAQLGDYYERRGAYAAAEKVARRQIQIEPWREEAHRQLMRVMAYQGRRGDALRQYKRLAELLMSELGLEPMPATQRLRRQIASAADERPNNLPARDPSFVGRANELALIHDYLANPDRRLINLVGPGGSGKTALAIEAGWQVASMYTGPFIDGVFLVPLVGINAPEAQNHAGGASYNPLATAVAEALAFSPTVDPARELADYLGDRRLLLILDNAEHLLTAVGDLAQSLLRGAAMLKIVVTSRTRLNRADEWLVEVGGLPVPEKTSPASTDDAPRLFVQRAQRLIPEIVSPGGDSSCPRPTIIRICELVEGLPLGVELAAPWVRLLSCQEIAAELEKSLDFLRSSAADVESRHQSLRAVFDYSWALLADSDRQILGRLAVFSGAFDRPAAQTIAGASLQSLARLVDYSLLQRGATSTGKAQRYEMLESLRHFAVEKQAASAEGTEQLHRRYSNYYLEFLATRLDDLRGRRQRAAVDEIAQEIDNIRAAWRLAVERRDLLALAGAQESLATFYYMRSWFSEGESNFALAADLVSREQPGPERDGLLARILAWQGWFRALRGQVSEGRRLLQEAAALLRQHDARHALGYVLPYLAVATSAAGDNATAEQLAREAQQFGRQLDLAHVESVSASVLSQILYLLGNYPEAREFGQRSLELDRARGNYWGMAFCLVNLGRAAFAAGDYKGASAHYREAIEIRETLADARGKALGLLYLGDAALAQDQLEPSRRAYQESLAIFREIGSRSGSAEALARLGRIALEEQKPSRARRQFADALSLARTGQAVQPMLEALWGLARLMAEEAPEPALWAAHVVALHPASREADRQAAGPLAGELARVTGLELPEELDPEMLDRTAGQLLRAARLT